MRHVEAGEVTPMTVLDLKGDDSLAEFFDHERDFGDGRSLVLDVAHLDTETVSLKIEGVGWVGFAPRHLVVVARPGDVGPSSTEA